MSHYNLILDSDSYKTSHWLQLPNSSDFKTSNIFSYLESRGGKYPETIFFGLQYLLKEYLSKPVTMENVEEAKEIAALHGVPFNYDGWKYIVEQLGGKIPVRIRAVPEGTKVPNQNVLMTCESTDPNVPWITTYIETLLMRTWYPITVCTQSYTIKQLILKYLTKTSEDPQAEIAFKLHDFGCRGVSSYESAAWGGASHLVNFMGTDTLPALMMARNYYHCPMAGFSIPAAEHSTITSWGRENEVEAYRNMLKQYGGEGKILAVVSDSYDIFYACEHIWGEQLKQEVIDSKATVVIRPDSGHPATVVHTCLELLGSKFGFTVNSKGYKVLNNVRVIQGDGVNYDSILEVLEVATQQGWSATNIAFGMGGALLQIVNRDTQQFAYKCSSMTRTYTDGHTEEVDVYKQPKTDSMKNSKRGRLDLQRMADGSFQTVRLLDGELECAVTAMQTVYENGVVLVDDNFTAIRVRSNL